MLSFKSISETLAVLGGILVVGCGSTDPDLPVHAEPSASAAAAATATEATVGATTVATAMETTARPAGAASAHTKLKKGAAGSCGATASCGEGTCG